jgi:hypothetical protein
LALSQNSAAFISVELVHTSFRDSAYIPINFFCNTFILSDDSYLSLNSSLTCTYRSQRDELRLKKNVSPYKVRCNRIYVCMYVLCVYDCTTTIRISHITCSNIVIVSEERNLLLIPLGFLTSTVELCHKCFVCFYIQNRGAVEWFQFGP